jgi:hypothetical protein
MKTLCLKLAKSMLLGLAAAVLVGCSTPPPTGPKPVVRTIDLVPATLPQYYSLQNQSTVTLFIPIASIGYSMNAKAKAKLFTEKLPDTGFRPDEELTNTVATALRAKGYEVNVLQDIKRLPDSADYIDLAKFAHKADALVHVYFSDVGIGSPRNTTDYFPRVSVTTTVYLQGNKSWPYESGIYYGMDARDAKDAQDDKSSYVTSDPNYKYSDFDDVMANLDMVRKHLKAGAVAAGLRIAEQVHAAVK